MPDLAIYVQVAQILAGLSTALKTGLDYFTAFSRNTPAEIERQASALSSTFDEHEILAVNDRISACRDRFIAEGSGEARVKCLCSVLRDVKIGNGGDLPDGEWQETWSKLKCDTF